jgi:hypothetical protein
VDSLRKMQLNTKHDAYHKLSLVKILEVYNMYSMYSIYSIHVTLVFLFSKQIGIELKFDVMTTTIMRPSGTPRDHLTNKSVSQEHCNNNN